MSPHVTDALSAYLDEELAPGPRAEVAAHLQECDDCRATLEDLRAIVAAAPRYPGRAPGRDLWPQIELGIREPRVLELRPRRGFGWRELVAASLLMAAAGGGAVWLALRPGSGPGLAVAPAPAAGAAPDVRNAAFAAQEYDRAVRELEDVLAAGRSRLDSTTVRTIEESLARIDAAIAEARAAIQRDSSNVYLTRQVTANMRRKLNLLRVATNAIAAKS